MQISHIILSILLGYLSGSIPFGLIITRLSGMNDIRSMGSGNIGATNVLRTGGKKLATMTLVLDVLKGTFAVTLVGIIDPTLAYIAGLAAVLGHIFPVWLRFNGGKGVATCLGVMLALSPLITFVSVLIWVTTAFFTRYSSLSALLAISAMPLTSIAIGEYQLAALCLVLAALNIYTHRENIQRLILKTETKIGDKKKK